MGINGKQRSRKRHIGVQLQPILQPADVSNRAGAFFIPLANFGGHGTSSCSHIIDFFDSCEMWPDKIGNILCC
jgi:hypothetical protein